MSYPQWSTQTQPWKQGWRGPVYGNVPFQPTNFPTYPQYPSNISQLLPGFNPPSLLPPPQLQQQLALPMNQNMQQPMLYAPIQNPPRPAPILAQPIPNPNNRPTQPIQNIEVQTFPTYVIMPAPFNGIELRSGRVVNKTNPTMVIQEEQVHNHINLEEQIDVQTVQREEQMTNPLNEERNTPVQQEIPSPNSLVAETPQKMNPPYPERLFVKKTKEPLEHNLETELWNICVNIPLLQAIKDIPIYAKIVRDLCIKNPGRKRKEPPVIQVVGQLSEFIT
jgi:hypothetical protein